MFLRETADYVKIHKDKLSERVYNWLMKSALTDKHIYTKNDIDFMEEVDNIIENVDVLNWIFDNQHSFRLTTQKQPTMLDKHPKTPCLQWLRNTNTSGTPWTSAKAYVHEIMWTMIYGIPQFPIKRNCLDIRCCNPQHFTEMIPLLATVKRPVGRPPGSIDSVQRERHDDRENEATRKDREEWEQFKRNKVLSTDNATK